MQDVIRPTRDEALAPVPRGPRKRRSRLIVLGLTSALCLGLAGGSYLHRFVDLDEASAWASERLQSGFEWARREVAGRIESLTTKPVTVVQASSPSSVASWTEPNSGIISDLTGSMDQVRAANETSARDLGERLDRLRIVADQNQREVIANLVQLAERLERIERHAKAGTVAAVVPQATQPVVRSPGPPPARPAIKAASKPMRTPIPKAKAKLRPRQPSNDSASGPDRNLLANWTVLEVLDGTAVLNGPQGLIPVGVGDTIPEIGRVQAIMRSGRRWIVATSKGVITAQ